MIKNRIGELVGIRYPLIQAPMNWVSGVKIHGQGTASKLFCQGHCIFSAHPVYKNAIAGISVGNGLRAGDGFFTREEGRIDR